MSDTLQGRYARLSDPQRGAGLRIGSPLQATQTTQVPTEEDPITSAYRGLDWQGIENSPNFANLPLETQRLIQNDWFTANVDSNPTLSALNESERRVVYSQFMNKAPSLVVEDLTEMGSEFLEAGEAFRTGDYSTPRMNLFQRTALGAVTGGIIGSTIQTGIGVAEMLSERDERESIRTLRRSVFSKEFSEGAGIFGLINRLVERLVPESVTRAINPANDGESLVYTPATQADRNAWEYMLSQAMQHEDLRKTLQRSSSLGQVTGTISDVGVSLLLGAPLRAASYGVANFGRAVNTARNAGSFITNSLLPEMLANAGEAGFMTAAEVMRDGINHSIDESPSAATAAGRIALLFGKNYLFDMGAWTMIRFGSAFLPNLGRVFSPRGYRGQVTSAPRGASPDDIRRFIQETLEGIDPALLKEMPDGVQRTVFNRMHASINRARNFPPDKVGTDEWFRMILTDKGFDLLDEAGGAIRLRGPLPLKKGATTPKYRDLGVFSTVDDAFKRAVEFGDELTGVRAAQTIAEGSRTANVKFRRIDTGLVDEAAKGRLTRTSIDRFLTPMSDGTLDARNVRSALDALTANSDKLPSFKGVSVREMQLDEWRRLTQDGKAVFLDQGRRVTAEDLFARLRDPNTSAAVKKRLSRASFASPSGSLTPEDVASVRRQLANVLEAASEGSEETVRKLAKRVSREIRNSADEYLRKTPASMRNLATELNAQGKKVVDATTGRVLEGDDILTLAPGSPIRVMQSDGKIGELYYRNSVEAYMGEIDTSWLNEDLLARHLLDEHGLRLRNVPNEGYLLYRGKDNVRLGVPAGSIEELLAKNPDLFPKRPLSTLTQDVIYDYGRGGIEISSRQITGAPGEVSEYMNRAFKKYDEVARSRTVITTPNGEVRFTPGDPIYRVEMPDLGFKKDFSSLEEAKEFLRRGVDDFDNMSEIARVYGTDIYHNGSYFVMPLTDGSYATSRSLEGMQAHLRTLANQTDNVPDMMLETGLPQSVLDSISENIRKYASPSFGTPTYTREHALTQHVRRRKNFGEGQKNRRYLNAYFGGQERTIELIASDIGDEAIVEAVFRGPMRANDLFRNKYSVVERGVSDLFSRYKRKEVHAMTAALLNPSKNADDIFKAMGVELTPRMTETMTATRELFDYGRDLFQVDMWKSLTDYLPRLRRYFEGAGNAVDLNSTARELFKKAGIATNTPEAAFFANNLRTRDIFHLTQDSLYVDDLILGYFRKGLKSQYLTEPTNIARKKIAELFADGKGPIDVDMTRYLNGFVDSLTGAIEDPASVMINAAAEDSIRGFFKGVLNKEGPEVTRIVDTMKQMTIAAHMSGRIFLPVRNMQQIWTTLGWRLGNDVTYGAMRELTTNPELYMKQLVDSGIITHGRAAILEMASEGVNRGAMKRLNEIGMTWFRNSDDFNRSVAALASWKPYDDAVRALNAGSISPEDFIRVSRLDRLQPDLQRRILSFTEIGQHDTARNILAKAWVDQTQFTYVHATNPKIFQGMFGRLFGHYGHYSTMFRDNFFNAFGSHVPMGVKVGQASQLAMNAAGLYFFFEKFLGVNAASFNPAYSMAPFAGGPYYSLLNTALSSFQPGFQGDIARARLGEDTMRTFLPGAAFVYAHQQAMSLMDRGYTAEGLFRLFSVPMIDPDRPMAR